MDVMTFGDDLRRFGPGNREARFARRSDRLLRQADGDPLRKLQRRHLADAPRTRPAFQSIYAFCRWSDDLGDEVGDTERSLELLAWWRGELKTMYQAEPRHPVMIALAETVRRHDIPIDPFEALISAFEQDQTVTEYLTYEQLLDYCTRSANPVGHLVLYVAGAFSPENARLADATCTALQLANFWQDVARDLAIGRIYLPREDRARFGYPESDLRALRFTPAFADLLRFEVARARDLLADGRALVSRIRGTARRRRRPVLARRLGDSRSRSRHGDSTCSAPRPALTRWTKVRLLGRARRGHGDGPDRRPSAPRWRLAAARIEQPLEVATGRSTTESTP